MPSVAVHSSWFQAFFCSKRTSPGAFAGLATGVVPPVRRANDQNRTVLDYLDHPG